MDKKTVYLNVKDIYSDEQYQSRAEQFDETTVANYTKKLLRGESLPPISVYKIPCEKGTYAVCEGHQRNAAHIRAGIKNIPCFIEIGGHDECILQSTSSNSAHGKPRTLADCYHAVKQTLVLPKCLSWTDTMVANHCKIGKSMVATCRKQLIMAGFLQGKQKLINLPTNRVSQSEVFKHSKTIETALEELRYKCRILSNHLGYAFPHDDTVDSFAVKMKDLLISIKSKSKIEEQVSADKESLKNTHLNILEKEASNKLKIAAKKKNTIKSNKKRSKR
jgi:ParB-like nuclease domain